MQQNRHLGSLFPIALLAVVSASRIALASDVPIISAPTGLQWNPTFNDTFTTTSALNGWTYDLGNNGGWGNGESETYTNSSQNVYVSGGNLNIQAIGTAGSNGTSYTSGRITTQNLFSQTYGLFEFRAQLPAGAGLWPAIWMMPANSTYGAWPQSGEMDVMESQGSATDQVQGSLHSGSNSGYVNTQTQVYSLPSGQTTTAWHTYDLQWNPTPNPSIPGTEQLQMNWYVDGQLYETQTGGWTIPSSAAAGNTNAPFDQPFYIIMNLAVGGSYTGYQTPGPGAYDMKINYVRAYQAALPTVSNASAQDNVNNLYTVNSNLNGADGGTGFGQWHVQYVYTGPTGGGGGGAGFISPVNSGIGAATPAFDIYVYPGSAGDTGLNSNITTATRYFGHNLAPGQTFTTDFNLNKGQTAPGNLTPATPATADSNLGWRLLDAAGKTLFAMTTFGGGKYWSTDIHGSVQRTAILYNYRMDDIFTLKLLDGAGDYTLGVTGNTATGQSVIFSGQIDMSTGGPAQVQYFNNNGGNGSDVQWSQMSITGTPTPEPGTAALLLSAGSLLLLTPRIRGSMTVRA